ncbi:MerR family DNA-binding protein [Nocardia fluminea]|uniref:MerR family DNA-binding protein n=1 Tax=Nocardia fluminea TaxID=134984 RepID=UPI00366BF973
MVSDPAEFDYLRYRQIKASSADGPARLIRVIKTAQRLGFTLDEVADLLAATQLGQRHRGEVGLQARHPETGRDRREAHRADRSP